MKSSLIKKILSISIVSIVLALVVVTIVLALVPKRLENPVANGYGMITVYQDGIERAYLYDADATSEETKATNKIYQEIENLHAESLKDNVLSALFQGTLSFDNYVTKTSQSSVISNIAKASGTKAIVFTYLGEETQVLKVSGEVYKDNSTMTSKVVNFDTIVMPLNKSENFEECTIYLVDSSTNKSSYQVKFLAHQADLYNYIASLDLGIVA